METFKIVVDGVKLNAKQRKEIEAGFEKVFLEALGPEEEIKIGPFPKLPKVKGPLINGKVVLPARLVERPEIEEVMNQVGRAGLVEQAALQPARFEADARLHR